jgi:transposase-like protein
MAITPDKLVMVGRALYGDRWQSELARDLGITARAMRYWLAGVSPRDHATISAALRAKISERRADLRLAARTLRD